MKINLKDLDYQFKKKPILVGGKAKEYYEIRKSGADIDLIISSEDYGGFSKKYPDCACEIWGDLGVKIRGYEIWRTICLFDYEYYLEDCIEKDDYKIVSLEKLLFMTALGIKKPKYLADLYLIVDKILKDKYQNYPKK